ncbi:hypothetical protein AMECASPLE_033604 [Ameca splendens]|uniref:Uncharacterized protein n=1 Tax=Ameca splendens TaxID=208324 RepID=A0ABV1AE72_9TELE
MCGQALRRHRLQAKGRSKRWMSGQSQRTPLIFQQFQLGTSSVSWTPAHSQTEIPPVFDPMLLSHTSNDLSSTSAMEPSASTFFFQLNQKMLMLLDPGESSSVVEDLLFCFGTKENLPISPQ